jgi:outer membrane protein insertion porin family
MIARSNTGVLHQPGVDGSGTVWWLLALLALAVCWLGRPSLAAEPAYRAQSPGYDSESALTGGGSRQGSAYAAPPAGQAGQMPLRRTGPDSTAGYSRGTSGYPPAVNGGNAVPGRPVQYSPQPGPLQGSPNGQPVYAPGGYPDGRFAQPSYPQRGYAPGQFNPAGPAANPGPPVGQPAPGMQPSPFRPPSPFGQPGGGVYPPPGGGMIGPQGPPPGAPQPGAVGGFGGPPGGPGMGGAGPPPLGGYDSEGGLFTPSSPFDQPPLQVPIRVGVEETQTGRLMFGVGVNSNAGLIGNIVIDEQNFDWRRVPTSWEDIRNATAFRGAGQQFRIEAMPGTQLSRYGFTFREPYLFDSRVNFGLDAYYFNRYFQNWTEQRVGGRLSFGYMLTPDLSTSLALRAENIGIFNPTVPTPPELSDVVGHNSLFSAQWTTVHDTRDSPFLPTQGHRVSMELEQAFGSYSFPRAVLGFRQHFLLYERPDGSGRHVLNLLNDTGFTGSHTPIFENFFAGGYNTIRGFYFRGASPLDMGVQVGGKFEFLNTVEYMFPITAGDALRGVVFTDFGTVETSTEIKWEDFRVSPGIGLRVTIPAMGPAPIALDLAFPVHKAPGDQTQIFNFFVGVQR